MDMLLKKLFGAILAMIAEFSMTVLKAVLDETPKMLENPMVEMGINFAMAVSAGILISSLIMGILYKLSGIEGDMLEESIGKSAIKFLTSLILIPLIPNILKFIYNLSFDILFLLQKAGIENLQSGNIGGAGGSLQGTAQYLMSKDFITTVVAAGFTQILLFIIFFVVSSFLALSLLGIVAELIFAVVLSPIASIGLYKNSDKLNTLIESFIGLLCLFGLQIFAIFWALSVITNSVLPGSDLSGSIINGLLAIAIISASSTPTVISVVTKPRNSKSGSGLMSKAFYSTQFIRMLKG